MQCVIEMLLCYCLVDLNRLVRPVAKEGSYLLCIYNCTMFYLIHVE